MQNIKKRSAAIDCASCIACGCCAKACPRAAASVFRGLYAEIDKALCVGCGKCTEACPVSLITMKESAA